MTIEDDINAMPPEVAKEARQYLHQWAYDCAVWDREGIAELGTRGEKCKASRRCTRIYMGTGS